MVPLLSLGLVHYKLNILMCLTEIEIVLAEMWSEPLVEQQITNALSEIVLCKCAPLRKHRPTIWAPWPGITRQVTPISKFCKAAILPVATLSWMLPLPAQAELGTCSDLVSWFTSDSAPLSPFTSDTCAARASSMDESHSHLRWFFRS